MAEFEHTQELVTGLYERGLTLPPKNQIIRIGTSVILKSGIWSPYLINMRPALSVDTRSGMPVDKQTHLKSLLIESVAHELDEINSERPFDHIFGSPEAGTPLASSLAAIGGFSLLWKRVIPKPGYGSHELLEGIYYPGQKVAQVDDVVTRADTKREADEFLRECDLESTDIAVFADREQGGRQAVEAMGLNLRSAVGAKALFEYLADDGMISESERDYLIQYTNNPNPPTEDPMDHPWVVK